MPLCVERPAFKPFEYPWAFEAWEAQQQCHWLPSEINLTNDVKDWRTKLIPSEINLVSHIFRFFTQSDVEVNGSYQKVYQQVFKPTEILMMLGAFSNIECFDDKTELLTSQGWKLCKDITTDDKVAQYNIETSEITFVHPSRVVHYPYNGDMHYYKDENTDICVTPNHDLILKSDRGDVFKEKSMTGDWSKHSYPSSAKPSSSKEPLTSLERIFLAIAASGTVSPLVSKEKTVSVFVKDTQKGETLSSLLKENDIDYQEKRYTDGVSITFSLQGYKEADDWSSVFQVSFVDLDTLTSARAKSLLEEAEYWGVSSVESRDVLQAVRVLAGDDVWTPYPVVKTIPYDGHVHCVSVPTQNIVSRRHDKVAITGNTVHIVAYSHLLDTIGMPETEYQAFLEYKEMKDKYDYMRSQLEKNMDMETLAETLAIFGAFTEGLQLFASFAILLNFPRHNKLLGMGQIIAYSVRDETLHCLSLIRLYKTLIREYADSINQERLNEKLLQACITTVGFEDHFIDLAFEQGPLENMTAEDVKRYIRFIADLRLQQLGLKPHYGISVNPFPWIDTLLNGKEHSAFFEVESTEYTLGASTGNWEDVWKNFKTSPAMESVLSQASKTSLTE